MTASTAPTGFAGFGLSPELLRRAAAAGWAEPTAIQRAALPAILQGRDVLGLAPTGSGKTAAFLLPLLQRMGADADSQKERPKRLLTLILSPTRELAAQTAAAAMALAPQLKTVLAVGGLSINPQMMALRGGAHVVVATPGRLLDLLAKNALRLGEVKHLVLDEADRLLDLGFADEMGQLLASLPARRQTLLFTATMPAAVERLARGVLSDALRIDVQAGVGAEEAPSHHHPHPRPAAPPSGIHQRVIEVDSGQRTPLLRHLIASERWPRVLVFVATQYAAEHVADKLRRTGLPAAALHGQLSQGKRSTALVDFRDGRIQVLVATDLAARGIDVVGLGAVVNHDLARSTVDHIHRIGRTGRAAGHGQAISFICADVPGSEAHFRLIEKRQEQRVARERVAGFEPVAPIPTPTSALPLTAADPNGGIKGRRKSKKDRLREAAVQGQR